MLTKTDIAAIRKADDICIHLNARHPSGLVRLIKRKPYNAKPFETDQEHDLTASVTVGCSSLGASHVDGAAIESGNVHCFAMAGIHRNQHCHVTSILATLRAGDEITFRFSADAHSNGYVAAAGLHADVVYLDVKRAGKRIASWEFDQSVTANNSARMVRGIAPSQYYLTAAAERRDNA